MHVFFICVEAILMGAPYAFPAIPPLLGQVMFWTGVAGLVLYPTWTNRGWLSRRVEPFHLITVGLAGVALCALVALGGLIWQRWQPVSESRAATPVASAPHPQRPATDYIRNINLSADPREIRPLALSANAGITTNRLRIFVDYSWRQLLGPDTWTPRQRIHIADLDVVREQLVQVQLVFKAPAVGPVSDMYSVTIFSSPLGMNEMVVAEN
jgi:hypothetical protein